MTKTGLTAMAVINRILADNNSDYAIGVYSGYTITIADTRYRIVAAHMGGGEWKIESMEEQPF